MRKENKRGFWIAGILLSAFALWTVLVCVADVRAIGPNGSCVGFATFNGFVHALTGTNFSLYVITDWLGLVPIGVVCGFALLGLLQWIKRRSVLLVDRSLLILGAFYLAVAAVYVLFECVVINRRPVLIDGILEASYPSSTTVLVLCVMPTAILQCKERIKSVMCRRCAVGAMSVLIAFTVIGRVLSGVHWASDIIGGILISAGLVALYAAVASERN